MPQELNYNEEEVLKELEYIAFGSINSIDTDMLNWVNEQYVEVEKGLLLRVLKISAKKESKINIVVIPGLSSHFLGWVVTDYVLSHIANVYHVESREKASAIHNKRKISYKLEAFARDLYEIVKEYQLDKDGFYCLGDSFGAEMVIKYLDLGFIPPKGLILISPVKTFSFSWWMRLLFILFPHWFYKPFLPLIRFVLKYFRTDMKNDAPTYYLNKRNVETGNSKRMKKCALELSKYHSEADYSKIKCPTYIIAASSDKMHDFCQSKEIARKIPNSVFEDVKYFSKTHSREIAEKIISFILQNEEKTKSE